MINIKRTLFAAAALAMLAGSVQAADKKTAAKKPEAATLENLQTAFNGASNAKSRYEAFAVKADAEGYAGVASLFRAMAVSEGISVVKQAKAIEALGAAAVADIKLPVVKSTNMNLKEARKNTNNDSKKMYRAFINKAVADKNDKAVMSFKGAQATQASHSKLILQALIKLGDWKAKKKFIVCQTCGYTTDDMTIKLCPECTQPREQFKEVE
ncbi:MAG TPA: rubrerythrin [Elusimicrobia bacterium]|nr:rubrerythrin [Elusimicrobiota bacterium]